MLGVTVFGGAGLGLTGAGLLGTLAHAVMPTTATETKSFTQRALEEALQARGAEPLPHSPLKLEFPMLWLALEIVLGLVLFVFIVWWTLPRRRTQDGDDPPK